MSAATGSRPKCCGFVTLSASVISPSVVKIGRDCMGYADKSSEVPYSAMVREMEK